MFAEQHAALESANTSGIHEIIASHTCSKPQHLQECLTKMQVGREIRALWADHLQGLKQAVQATPWLTGIPEKGPQGARPQCGQ